jgi:signal transduction histidine kinase
MPDGIQPPPDATAPELAAETADGALIRRVRRNLVLWSGGTTLLILVALAIALYVAAATSLANAGIAQLDARMAQIQGVQPDPDDSNRYGYIFGGGGSGTFAMILDPSGTPVFGPSGPGGRIPPGLPYDDGVTAAAAATEGRDIRTTSLQNTPVRILTQTVDVPGRGVYTVQVLQDRTTEQQTLEVIAIVLVVGGILVLIVSFGFGTLYARRALVPIRESLTNQRAALRRQREFAADASHELRTPIAVIKSSVEELRRKPEHRIGEAAATLNDMEAEADHLTGLVEDLLLLARADSGVLQLRRVPVDLTDAAGEALRSLAHRAEERSVELELDASPAPVSGDPDRLRQLIGIVVDNAIRHSPSGGRVRVGVHADGRQAAVSVEDEGRGIRPDDLPRVFDRFWRAADAPHEGTGLGLAIARSIAEQHEGTIRATNRPARGTRFEIRLPLLAAG